MTHLLRFARLALLMLSALALALGPASEAYAAPDGAALEAPAKQQKKGKKKKKKKKKSKKKGKKKVGNIQMTGLKSIDGFFGDARSIDRRLDAAQKARRDGRTSIATAMGLPKSASLGDAIAELDRKTKGKLSIVMNGAVPEITPAGMMPSDVRAGLDAVNGAMNGYVDAITNLKGVPEEAASLIKKAQDMPEKVKAEFIPFSIVKLPDQLKAVKKVRNNIEVTLSLPRRSTKVVKGLNDDLTMIVNTFGGSWPPGARK